MSTIELSRKELVQQSFDCCMQCVRAYGSKDLSEQIRENLINIMAHFKMIGLRDIDKEVNQSNHALGEPS